ncbi:NnrS family protein [Marinobacter sp. NSM]|uniref:NnrS family protein n=1 Tax=Marinobacter sp. NSM TaxID=3458004 RepID=UPI004035FAA1
MQSIPASPERASASVSQLFSYPFRIFFLSMTVPAIVAIPLWVLEVTGTVRLPLAMPGLFWHQHEMLFGFLSAAIAGFLLTAVCVWTQTDRTHGALLAGLWGVWLAGCLLLAFGGNLPEWLVQGVNLAFLPLVMIDAGWRVWKARQKRQVMILVVLGLLWLMQIGFVTRLDMAAVFSMILLMVSLVTGWQTVTAILAVVAAVLMLVRLANWKGWLVRSEPLLWILHLSILWVPVALLLLAGSLLAGWPSNAWTHAAGTGAVGCLILGVIARVSLGHTGRPLILPKGMVLAFVAVQLAAVIRVITAFDVIPWHPGIGTSTALWVIAYAIFLIRYTGVLASPRADGREG